MPVIVALVEGWLAWKFWWVLVALAGALVLGRAIGGWLARRDDRAAARRRRDAELCAGRIGSTPRSSPAMNGACTAAIRPAR
jgi:hypothetical protein